MKAGWAVAAAVVLAPASGQAQTRPDQQAFFGLYKELVETNTAASVGSCTQAAEQVAARMKAAGFPASDLHLFAAPEAPKHGGLVAVLPGSDPKAKAILLLAHIDVVEAKREDWSRDPFKLTEEDGWFYARGAFDDKAQAAIWADTLIRYKREGYRPKRTLKMALTCGEEGGQPFNGARWLAQNRRELIDAAFGLNEGAGGQFDVDGRRVAHTVLAAEKSSTRFTLETTNPGGHSSLPQPDNAIYRLAHALEKVEGYRFPVHLIDANRGYLQRMGPMKGGEVGRAMTALAADPNDKAADGLLSRDVSLNATLRTTCVATQLEGGHAPNALPQRARAGINCRVMPGESFADVRAQLVRAINDPAVMVSEPANEAKTPTPALPKSVLGPVETISQAMWPGVPVVPILQPAATDAYHMNAVGIPTYGVSGLFVDPDLGRIHGKDERIRVKSIMEGRDFSYRLIKAYADAP